MPDRAPARLTADSRYVLLVNGKEVGRGPVRSQPRRMRYDDYDLAPFLRPGDNAVTVLVTYYAAANSLWQPAAPNATLGAHAVVVFECELDGHWLVTDEQWRVQRLTGWTIAPLVGFHDVPVEVVDARAIPPEWAQWRIDDAWPVAAVARAGHPGALARSRPPTDPYGALLPRPIGPLTGEACRPTSYLLSPAVACDAPVEHPVTQVEAFCATHTGLDHAEVGQPISFTAESATARLVTVDFGRIVCGFVEFDLLAPPGTRVDLWYQERPIDPGVPRTIANITGARYIARGSDDRFRALEVSGLRYIRLLVSSDVPGEIQLSGIRVREHLYPLRGDAYFSSSDSELDALYAAGRRTVWLNSADAFTDCPTREQRAWVGDGVVHQMVHLTTSTDWSLAQWYLELANSPRSDGMLPKSVVGEMEYNGGATIPDWALHWIHGVHNWFRYCGDPETLRSLLPAAEQILRWFLPYRDAGGVLTDVPEWTLVDWSAIYLTGASSILTALWARGLREFAQMSDYLGNRGNADWARRLLADAEAGFEIFWDAQRGTYIDHVLDGVPQPPASQLAGAAAIVSGLAPRGRWTSIADWITDRDRMVVRTWVGGDGGYDDEKIAEHMRGIQTLTWNPHTESVRAEPFGSYLVHDALAECGRKADLVRALRDWSGFRADGYDTFGECWGWGTPAHGWSATPTRDLVQYLLGIQPDEPGFASARIAPAFGTVAEFRGAAPTPQGLLHVSVSGGSAIVESPVPFTFIHGDGRASRHAAGTATFGADNIAT
ncbi:alpha-L-rhamnosidase N-terminal domain-containing protein [Nocardia cyriacigeorgica]|uniref:alpha-L-rhamnosidase-related protein n=1 Tax=Nocardia cyriacigeorgica TaxID=135487 RepID=UPI001895663A|nr:alpha-L-rhamnosidase N-terminal domain-containing protein [Nocardia cyriacigeorgica]MBF6440218.1 alpha-L-rhamnosidase N-terminal domain-containing protein [Nocardia cyriacigeorgica]